MPSLNSTFLNVVLQLCLASMIAAETNFWKFLPTHLQGSNVALILLMEWNHELCVLQFIGSSKIPEEVHIHSTFLCWKQSAEWASHEVVTSLVPHFVLKQSVERGWPARLLFPSYTDPLANFAQSWGETEDVDMAVMYYSIKAWIKVYWYHFSKHLWVYSKVYLWVLLWTARHYLHVWFGFL